jgi:hypothetical protein
MFGPEFFFYPDGSKVNRSIANTSYKNLILSNAIFSHRLRAVPGFCCHCEWTVIFSIMNFDN